MMTQEPQTVRLLPLEVVEADEVVESAGASARSTRCTSSSRAPRSSSTRCCRCTCRAACSTRSCSRRPPSTPRPRRR
jgi:hypothetical protein